MKTDLYPNPIDANQHGTPQPIKKARTAPRDRTPILKPKKCKYGNDSYCTTMSESSESFVTTDDDEVDCDTLNSDSEVVDTADESMKIIEETSPTVQDVCTQVGGGDLTDVSTQTSPQTFADAATQTDEQCDRWMQKELS